MKKRGFTLIELLAVIVVLAIIALIATPLVLNTIENSRKGAFEQTINNIVKASKLYQAKVQMNDDEPLTECRYFSFGNDVDTPTVRDNKTYYPVKSLSLKGKLPTEGEVKVCLDDITVDASDGTYSAKYDGDKVNIVKGDLASSDLTTPLIENVNTTATTNTIIVTVQARSQSNVGVISNYYYKINDGNYIKTEENSYIFDELDPNTEYTITVKVENKSGIESTEFIKKVTTSSFGELTISVEPDAEWSSSKIVTITGEAEDYTIEYKVKKYNETTLELEESEVLTYSEPFTLDTMATQDYPTTIVAWYNSNGNLSEEQTMKITKIDTTSPNTTNPAVTASTTSPTNEANIVVRQADDESGLDAEMTKYGYSLSEDGEYTWQTSSDLTDLTAGTTYYVKTKVTNNAGKTVESVATVYQAEAIGSCSVTPLTSGWAVSKDVQITGSQTGTQLQYQIGGTDDDKWNDIENNGTKNITENTTVYCRLWDGKTAGGTGNGEVNNIDTTAPTDTAPTVEQSATDRRTLIITNNQIDNESDLDSTTLLYGYSTSSNGEYTWQSSSTFGNLTAGQTYYFKTKVSNNAGLEKESNYTEGSIEYTGIPAGSYSAGDSITYAGVDWYVISDNGDRIILITKSNISTGKYGNLNTKWSGSTAQTVVDNWLYSNGTLIDDKYSGALIADSTTGDQIRLPRVYELSTKIPNDSGTAFWTMSDYSEFSNLKDVGNGLIIIGDSTGVANTDIALTETNSYYQGTSTSIPGGTKASSYKNDYLAAVPSQPFSTTYSKFDLVSLSGFYSYAYSQNYSEQIQLFSVCTNSGIKNGVVVSANHYYAVGSESAGCSDKRVYYELEEIKYTTAIGYRPVITVLEK